LHRINADDEIFGCGGFIAKAIHFGADVLVLYMNVGNVSFRIDDRKETTYGYARLDEVRKVSEYLNFRYDIMSRRPEEEFAVDVVSRRELVNWISERIACFMPELILIPTPGYHQDHQACYEAGMTACRPPSSPAQFLVKNVWVYNSHMVTWNIDVPFSPNMFVDITEVIKEKITALGMYESQVKDFGFLSTEHTAESGKMLGREFFMDFVEGFELRRGML